MCKGDAAGGENLHTREHSRERPCLRHPNLQNLHQSTMHHCRMQFSHSLFPEVPPVQSTNLEILVDHLGLGVEDLGRLMHLDHSLVVNDVLWPEGDWIS